MRKARTTPWSSTALGGDDVIIATTLPAEVMKLTVDGGAGNDAILGSQGADMILGGDGDDFAFGDNGNDLAQMGAGDDVFQWNPGDGNDTIEGQDGTDTMLFFGANVAENIDISANGGRATFFRDIANVTMDMNDTEVIAFNALGGADNITINDMSGTDVTNVVINLAGTLGGSIGDGAPDKITINATNSDDVILVSNNNGVVTVSGLATQVTITGFEAANDQLVINGLAGDDVISAWGFPANTVQLTANGGDGNDVLIGSEGADT